MLILKADNTMTTYLYIISQIYEIKLLQDYNNILLFKKSIFGLFMRS